MKEQTLFHQGYPVILTKEDMVGIRKRVIARLQRKHKKRLCAAELDACLDWFEDEYITSGKLVVV